MSLKRIFCTTFLILVTAGVVSAQSQDDLVQMLNKALAEVEASREVIKAKNEQIALQEKLISQQEQILVLKDAVIEAKDKEIQVLKEITCNERETSFRPFIFKLFVWKKKECY